MRAPLAPVPRRSHAVLALVVAAAVLGMVGASASATPGAPDQESAEAALAARFAPVMVLVLQEEPCGAGEPFEPSDVDVLMGNDSVALRGPWSTRDLVAVAPTPEQLSTGLRDYELDLPGNPLKPGCAYEKWARRQWGKDARATVYAHVAHEEGVPDRLALQFAFFYPFNDYNNKHESDWERIQLEFATADPARALTMTPDRVVYAQHYGAESASWGDDKLETVDGTHPVVHVAAGSHASFYAEGLFVGNSESTGFGCDTTVGPGRAVHPLVRTIPSDADQARADYPWIAYEGHWGQVGPTAFYTGPTGPNQKVFWTKPFTWSEGARTHSLPVPGAGLAGGPATQFFCSAVGTGSNLFRRWVADPGPVALVLGLGLLGMVWWLRRSSWRSAPTPVVRRRSAGEVIGASLAWVRHRPRLFWTLALVTAVPALAAAGAQAASATAAVPLWPRLVLVLLAVTALVATSGAVAQAVVAPAADRMTARAALRAMLPRLPRTLSAVAIGALVVVLASGTVLLLPVAAMFVVGWSIVVPVVQIEGRRTPSALRRSLLLARRTIATVVPLLVVGALISLLAGLLLSSLAFIVFTAPFAVVSVIPAFVGALAWPLVSVLFTFAYANAVAEVDGAEARADDAPRTAGQKASSP